VTTIFTTLEEQRILNSTINNVWGSIADSDVQREIGNDNEAAIEACIDADRLTTFGFPQADALVNAAVKAHGYTKVLKRLSKMIRLV
jgi:hypothetical protein